MKEWVFWAYCALGLAALYVVPSFPAIGAVVLIVGIVLCVACFRRPRKAPGNPALGLLGNVILLSGVYSMVAFPRLVLNDLVYSLQFVLIFGGFALVMIWVFVNAWRKRAAMESCDDGSPPG